MGSDHEGVGWGENGTLHFCQSVRFGLVCGFFVCACVTPGSAFDFIGRLR